MTLPYRILAALALLSAAFVAGWRGHMRWRAADDAKQALEQSESARESERLAQRNITRIGDELTQSRLRTERAGAATADRLRKLAEAHPEARCPAGSDDATPAAAMVPEDVRADMVALAVEADRVADRLRACQALLAQP